MLWGCHISLPTYIALFPINPQNRSPATLFFAHFYIFNIHVCHCCLWPKTDYRCKWEKIEQLKHQFLNTQVLLHINSILITALRRTLIVMFLFWITSTCSYRNMLKSHWELFVSHFVWWIFWTSTDSAYMVAAGKMTLGKVYLTYIQITFTAVVSIYFPRATCHVLMWRMTTETGWAKFHQRRKKIILAAVTWQLSSMFRSKWSITVEYCLQDVFRLK